MGNNFSSPFPRTQTHQVVANGWIDLNSELPDNNIIDLITDHNNHQLIIDSSSYPYTYHIINIPNTNDTKYLIQCPLCNSCWVDYTLPKCSKCTASPQHSLSSIINSSSPKTCKSFFTSFLSKCTNKCKTNISHKLQELHSVHFILNKESVSLPNYDNTDSFISDNHDIQIHDIVSSQLLPFLQTNKILLQNNITFHINNYIFKVNSTSPPINNSSSHFGYISHKTNIHCNSFYSTTSPLNRVLLITTSKYKNFTERYFQSIISSISNRETIHIQRNTNFEVNNYTFYTRNCLPECGIINQDTVISVENKLPFPIIKVKFAILNTHHNQISVSNLTNNYFRPYFLGGIERYIEKGDTFKIGSIEVFVLHCQPQSGFVVKNTLIRFKFGKTKNQCIAFIQREDNKIANEMNSRNTMNQYTTLTSILREFMMITHNEIINERINQHRRIGRIVANLPTLNVNEKFLERMAANEDEMNKKCVICMEKYSLNENVKTLPCFHIFHSQCIDEWLNGKESCPICKCKVDIDDNANGNLQN